MSFIYCVFFGQNSKKLPTVEYRRRRKQTKRLEMPFLKTDISWQLGVIGSVYPPIADIFSLLLDWIGVRKINLIFPWLFCHLLKKFISLCKNIFFPQLLLDFSRPLFSIKVPNPISYRSQGEYLIQAADVHFFSRVMVKLSRSSTLLVSINQATSAVASGGDCLSIGSLKHSILVLRTCSIFMFL